MEINTNKIITNGVFQPNIPAPLSFDIIQKKKKGNKHLLIISLDVSTKFMPKILNFIKKKPNIISRKRDRIVFSVIGNME
jgi:hypothetical protein